jgi:SP family arabinose:H+ symporter-like MFS transporter
MLVVYFVNYLISGLGTEAWNISTGWRWMIGSETLPALFFLVLLFFVPESPRWLIKQGRVDQGRKILANIVGEERANAQVADIQKTVAQESGSSLSTLQGVIRLLARRR